MPLSVPFAAFLAAKVKNPLAPLESPFRMLSPTRGIEGLGEPRMFSGRGAACGALEVSGTCVLPVFLRQVFMSGAPFFPSGNGSWNWIFPVICGFGVEDAGGVVAQILRRRSPRLASAPAIGHKKMPLFIAAFPAARPADSRHAGVQSGLRKRGENLAPSPSLIALNSPAVSRPYIGGITEFILNTPSSGT